MTYSYDDEARLTRMIDNQRCLSTEELARHLLEQGVTLPDPTDIDTVADYVVMALGFDDTDGLRIALRELFAPEAVAAAADKVRRAGA